MKGCRNFAAALLSLGACLAAASAAEGPPALVALEAPPGWSDVTPQTKVKGVLLALRGPQSSAFVVAAMPAAAADTAAGTRAYLSRVLDGLRAGARLDYRSSGRVETQTFRNGVSARLIRADLDGKPRLIVAAVDAGGPPLLATLSSAAPDAMLAPLFGALRLGPSGGVKDSGTAQSLDGQLQVALGGGLRSREPSGAEQRQGVVLAVLGAGSEVLFLKLSGDAASPKDQAAIVRATAAAAASGPLSSVSPARRAATPAGPAAVYAWARITGSAGLRFSAGFLPWAYWGYSVLARGPQADELMVGTLAALKQGPAAVPRLVAASPKLEIAEGRGGRWAVAAAAAAAAAALAAIGLIAWSRRRKSANL